MRSISKKIILTGGYAVGKTSLINRFVYQRFSTQFQSTIGVKIDRKTIDMPDTQLTMLIWDIGGEQSQARIADTYYLGSSGVIYVFDVTNTQGYQILESDIEYIRKKLPKSPILIVGNKKDLVEEAHLDIIRSSIPYPIDFFTSAKENQNVEDLFSKLAKTLIED